MIRFPQRLQSPRFAVSVIVVVLLGVVAGTVIGTAGKYLSLQKVMTICR